MQTAVCVVLSILGTSFIALAQTSVVDFENLPEGQAAGRQINGVSFTNAVVLQSAASLNEAEYPPRSGSKVVCDVGGAMRVEFAQPVKTFTAYVTHAQSVTLKVLSANGEVLSQTVAGGDNRQGTGKAPNEAIQIGSDGGGFTRVEIVGAAGGSSFTLDDITTSLAQPAAPTFFLDTNTLTFDHVSGRLAPPPMPVVVSGEPSVAFTVTTPTPWIQAIASNTRTPANVAIAVHPDKMESGTYYGSVVFASSKGERLTLQVTLRIAVKPSLYSSPASFSFRYKKGDPAPAAQLIRVGALSANVDFFVLTKDPWVKVSPDYATTGHVDLIQQVTVDVSKLAAGHYESAIYLYSNEATNSPLTVPVVLDVSEATSNEAGRGN